MGLEFMLLLVCTFIGGSIMAGLQILDMAESSKLTDKLAGFSALLITAVNIHILQDLCCFTVIQTRNKV